jgi:diaminohydroxyphosphoribosylaminopyrimidine deaminase/5-amino-6-(5-phosphoribosylamino)uracil reductase
VPTAASSRQLAEDAHFLRALELAERGRGKTGDHPLVGAVVVRDGEVVGEGWYEYDAVRHAEVIALEQAGEAARGSTLYVTLEPCSHHGRTPPCADAVAEAGVARAVVGARDPNPVVDGRGLERLAAAGLEVQLLDDLAARRQNEAWRVWKSLGRPFVTYKAAVTFDGRVVVPGRRWVSGEESRRRVHELRADSDAVAVGMGTVRADAPRLDARDVAAARQPRRLAFGRGPLPEGSELELHSGPLEEELRTLAAEGVRSLLLEGGPTLATAFLAAGLVDKLLLFVAPVIAGVGPHALDELAAPVDLLHLRTEPSGEDVLLEAYVREP